MSNKIVGVGSFIKRCRAMRHTGAYKPFPGRSMTPLPPEDHFAMPRFFIFPVSPVFSAADFLAFSFFLVIDYVLLGGLKMPEGPGGRF